MYVTDALRVMGENTAKYVGGGYIRKQWIDIVTPKKQDSRTGEEIIEHMKAKIARIGGESSEPI